MWIIFFPVDLTFKYRLCPSFRRVSPGAARTHPWALLQHLPWPSLSPSPEDSPWVFLPFVGDFPSLTDPCAFVSSSSSWCFLQFYLCFCDGFISFYLFPDPNDVISPETLSHVSVPFQMHGTAVTTPACPTEALPCDCPSSASAGRLLLFSSRIAEAGGPPTAGSWGGRTTGSVPGKLSGPYDPGICVTFTWILFLPVQGAKQRGFSL